MMKTPSAKRTQAVLPLCHDASVTLLLSGTPALNRPAELYPQLEAIGAGAFFKKFSDFGKRYCDPTPNHFSGGMGELRGQSVASTRLTHRRLQGSHASDGAQCAARALLHGAPPQS